MIPANPNLPVPPGAFAEFLRALFTTGDVRVANYTEAPPALEAEFAALLADLDAARRDEEDALPPLEPAAAEWAAVTLYRACQFLLCRDVPGEVVTRELARPCPGATRTPATHYSVDLFFAFLPDLAALARQLAPADPLVTALRDLGRAWPLSSAGMDVGAGVDTTGFSGSVPLLRWYADRVSERGARDRLDDPRLRALLRTDAGLFPDLVPFPPATYAHE